MGTRGSALARAQAAQVAVLLERRLPGTHVEVCPITVSGDRAAGPSPTAMALRAPTDKARWVDAIEDALAAGDVDLAVHSAKDVPTELAPGLTLLGAPAREDPRDVLCGASGLDELPPGARVGTNSVRRAAQLLAVREDLQVRPLRGNVDTRLRRPHEGGYEAIVLALAGLRRLGLEGQAGAPLDDERFVPAAGQGVLALQGRADDERAARAAAAISDPDAVTALRAERALVGGLDASCHTPVGAHARLLAADELAEGQRAPAGQGRSAGQGEPAGQGGSATLTLSAFVGLPDGSAWATDRLIGPADQPELLGRRVAERLLSAGAGELLSRALEMALADG